MIAERSVYRDLDRTLILCVLILCGVGLASIYSATQAKELAFGESYILRQIYWLIAGLVLMAVVMNISYQRFIDVSYVLYALSALLLALVFVLGRARLGAQRWFTIGSFAFQPSEFMKLSLILALANYAGYNRDRMPGLTGFFVPCVLLGIPFILVVLQPDLGTALLMLPVFFSILMIANVKARYLALMVLSGLACLPLLWHMLRDYQRQRLLVFLDPNVDPLGAGYTIIQSKIAVGSGGLFGKGWLAGTQNQLNFLPERHTDFIFSVIGEEWGLAGSCLVMLLFFIISKKAFEIAASTSDMYGKSIATGIAVLFSLQVIINIGMTIGLMPVVGLPLPFISYGGSSLIATLVSMGLLLNVKMRRSMF